MIVMMVIGYSLLPITNRYYSSEIGSWILYTITVAFTHEQTIEL